MRKSTLQDTSNFGAVINRAPEQAIRRSSCAGCGAEIGALPYA